MKYRNKAIDIYTKYESDRGRGIIERERCNVVGQCIKRFERVRGVADSFPLKKKEKNDLGGQRSKNEKCL